MSLSPAEEQKWLISPLADLVLITLMAILFSSLVGSYLVIP